MKERTPAQEREAEGGGGGCVRRLGFAQLGGLGALRALGASRADLSCCRCLNPQPDTRNLTIRPIAACCQPEAGRGDCASPPEHRQPCKSPKPQTPLKPRPSNLTPKATKPYTRKPITQRILQTLSARRNGPPWPLNSRTLGPESNLPPPKRPTKYQDAPQNTSQVPPKYPKLPHTTPKYTRIALSHELPCGG